MIPTTHHPATRTLIMVLGCCLAAAPLAAQQAPLGEIDLTPSPIVVDLDRATVRIIAGGSAEPKLRWWRARPDEPGTAELDANVDAGAIMIERPPFAEGETIAGLVVEITVAAEQPIAVFGSDLDLSVEREPPEEPESSSTDATPTAATPGLVELQLVESRATLTGVGGVTATLDGSTIDMHETTGQHQLTVIGGGLRIIGHEGSLTVTSEGAEVMVENAARQISVRANGGSIDLRAIRGRFKIEAADAHLQLLDMRGNGTITVTDSNIDIRESTFPNLQLKGVSSYVTVSNCSSPKNVDLTGGSLTADGLTGDITATARDGATMDLTDLKGEIKLTLQKETSADLRAIHGNVIVNARGARLTIEGATGLALTADDTQATLSAIAKLTSFQATRSDVDLDLSECRDRALTLSVQAESNVRVWLSAPCRVAAKGLAASLASQIDVRGCELQLGQGGRWSTKRMRGIDGQRPVTLTAKVSETAELTVQGRP
jgi:hypothetical protein